MSAVLSFREVGEKLHAKRTELNEIFKAATIDGEVKMDAETVGKVRERNDELTALAAQYEQLADIEDIRKSSGTSESKSGRREIVPNGDGRQESQEQPEFSVERMLTQSKSYQAMRAGQTKTAVFELGEQEFKTLITLTTIAPQAQRRAGIQQMALDETTVADLVLQGQASSGAALNYLEETTFTNAAATVAEGDAKPESALAFTERTDPFRKIATWIPVTDEALQDNAMLRSYIEGRLVFMVQRTLEQQVLLGDGTAPNISGILDRTGIQTQAKGADPTPDAVYKAMTKIRTVAFAEPTNVVFNPLDWQDVRLLRTADGLYIWGSPMEAGPERIWGLSVRQTPVMTQNTALVGAFRPWAQLFRIGGITVTASSEHSTFFVENKIAILAEIRAALAVYRPAAFCTVTGV